jgi:hypothetical protein
MAQFVGHGGYRIKGTLKITEDPGFPGQGKTHAIGAAHFPFPAFGVYPGGGKGPAGKIAHAGIEAVKTPGDKVRRFLP